MIRKLYGKFLRKRALIKVSRAATFFYEQGIALHFLNVGGRVVYGGDYGAGSTHLCFWSAVWFALKEEGQICVLAAENYPSVHDKFDPLFSHPLLHRLGVYIRHRSEFRFHEEYGGSRIKLINSDNSLHYRSMQCDFLAIDTWEQCRDKLTNLLCMLRKSTSPAVAASSSSEVAPDILRYWEVVDASHNDNPYLDKEYLQAVKGITA